MFGEQVLQKNMKFPQSEYDRRIRRTKEAMDRCGMELLLVVDPANMNYLTGYDGWSFYVHQGVILWIRRLFAGHFPDHTLGGADFHRAPDL